MILFKHPRIRAMALSAAICSSPVAIAQSGNWVQSPVNGHYYALTPPGNWEQCEQWAVANNAHLVTIRSSAEQQWLHQTYSAPLSGSLWIGLNDLQQQGVWEWVSGEPVTFTFWGGGEPNFPGVERRVEMNPPSGQWNNQSNWVRPGIAERGPPGSYTTFGIGCVGPNGLVPDLQALPGQTPAIGSSSVIRVSNLPLSVTIPVFILGFSNSHATGAYGNYPLPLDLGILGWPGCDQLVSLNDSIFTITTTGYVDHTVTIPAFPFLVGMQFHAQALVLYTPSGVAVSNAVTGTVGY